MRMPCRCHEDAVRWRELALSAGQEVEVVLLIDTEYPATGNFGRGAIEVQPSMCTVPYCGEAWRRTEASFPHVPLVLPCSCPLGVAFHMPPWRCLPYAPLVLPRK